MYICTCCDQLWYKHSVSPADRLRLINPDITKYLQSVRSVDDIEWICQTCNNHLKKGRVPPCAIANGMQFPGKPSFFDLNELECRLIAPRLAFQKIFQAPRGGQLKITGNVVNVPADVNSTVNMLPRLPDETGTIKVQLKRRFTRLARLTSAGSRKFCLRLLGCKPGCTIVYGRLKICARYQGTGSRIFSDEKLPKLHSIPSILLNLPF